MAPRSGLTPRRRRTGPWRGCGSCPARCWRRPPPRTATAAARATATARPPAPGPAAGAVTGGCCRGWAFAARRCCRGDGAGRPGPGIPAALADLEAAREAEDAARREARGSVPGEGAGRAGAAGPDTGRGRGRGRGDRAGAGGRRSAAASATPMTSGWRPRPGRGVRGTRPVPPEQAAPVPALPGTAGRGQEGRTGQGRRGRRSASGHPPPGGDPGEGARGSRSRTPPRPVRDVSRPGFHARCTAPATAPCRPINCRAAPVRSTA